MKKIAVIGFGHGGAVAAIKLAQAGFSVDIYERRAQEEVGFDWYDDIRFDVFELCGISPPPADCYVQKGKWLFVSPDCKNSLAVPPAKPMEEISVSRRGLCAHLAKLAAHAGCNVCYSTEVQSLALEDNRVVGICVNGELLRYDLTIDASGLGSPFRGQVPADFGIQANPGRNDLMKGYRAFYARAEGSQTPSPACTLYIKHLDGVGISWCNLNQFGEVDVLIGRIGSLSEEEIEAAIADLSARNEIMPDAPPLRARRVDIAVRCPVGIMVADGYAAVGDSAFMTMPIMGSGIESAMKAGVWLAEAVVRAEDCSARGLWSYQTRFYREPGADFAFIDVFKRWALNLSPEKINWLFGCGVVTGEDMALLSTDEDNPPKLGLCSILKKALIILRRPSLVAQAVRWLFAALNANRIASEIPQSYDKEKIRKWLARYNGILQKIEK